MTDAATSATNNTRPQPDRRAHPGLFEGYRIVFVLSASLYNAINLDPKLFEQPKDAVRARVFQMMNDDHGVALSKKCTVPARLKFGKKREVLRRTERDRP